MVGSREWQACRCRSLHASGYAETLTEEHTRMSADEEEIESASSPRKRSSPFLFAVTLVSGVIGVVTPFLDSWSGAAKGFAVVGAIFVAAGVAWLLQQWDKHWRVELPAFAMGRSHGRRHRRTGAGTCVASRSSTRSPKVLTPPGRSVSSSPGAMRTTTKKSSRPYSPSERMTASSVGRITSCPTPKASRLGGPGARPWPRSERLLVDDEVARGGQQTRRLR
jgi:hypothetical protein